MKALWSSILFSIYPTGRMTRCSYFCVPRDLAMAVTARKLWWLTVPLCPTSFSPAASQRGEATKRTSVIERGWEATTPQTGARRILFSNVLPFFLKYFGHPYPSTSLPAQSETCAHHTTCLRHHPNFRYFSATSQVLRCLGERWSLYTTPRRYPRSFALSLFSQESEDCTATVLRLN